MQIATQIVKGSRNNSKKTNKQMCDTVMERFKNLIKRRPKWTGSKMAEE